MAESKLDVVVSLKDKFSGELKKINSDLDNSASKAKSLAKGLAGFGAVIGSGLAVAANQAAKFDSRMGDLQTLFGDNTAAVDDLSSGIKDMVKEIPVSADELGASAYSIVSAGVTDTADALSVLEQSSKLSVAGLSSSEEATDLLTTALNAFGKEGEEASNVADVLFKTVQLGKTDVSKLSQSFGKMAGNASAAGIEFEDVQAATAALTSVTGKTSESQNALAQVFLEMTVAGGKLDKSLGENGSSLEELNQAIGEQGLVGGMEEVRDKLGVTDTEFKNMFSSAEGGTAVFQLLTSANESAKNALNEMTGEANSLNDAFNQQSERTEKQFQLLKNNLNVALGELGSQLLPAVNDAIQTAIPFIQSMTENIGKLFNFFSEHKEALIIFSGAILGALVPAFLAAIPAIAGAAVSFGALAISLAPFIAGGAIIGGIVAGIIWIVRNWDMLKKKAIEVWGFIKERVSQLTSSVTGFVQKKWDELTNFINAVGESIKTGLINKWNSIKRFMKIVVSLITGLVVIGFEMLGIDLGLVLDAIKTKFIIVWNAIKNFIKMGMIAIRGFVTGTLNAIKGIWAGVWGAISGITSSILSSISSFIKEGFAKMKEFILEFTEPLGDIFSAAWEGVKKATSGAIDGLKSLVVGGLNWIIRKANNLIGKINSTMQKGADILGFSAPQINQISEIQMAEGGIVTGPTQALIGEGGEPEMVLPLSKARQMGFGGGMTVNVTVEGDVSGEELVEKVGEQLTRNLQLSSAVT